MKGFMLRAGKTVPKGITEKLQDTNKINGWCKGTGTVHVLWGICFLMLWCANEYVAYALYSLGCFAVCGIISIIMIIQTTRKYSNRLA